ncbi:MAG: HAMP domain-containing sensor histidine kinase [Firmicutes bacterium]|nr:HAMP domain-containing sensor histidine kinase [Bacillota bacterium]
MVFMVSAEILACVVISYGLSAVLNNIFHIKAPVLPEIIGTSLLIGILVTGFMSKWFFDPIKKLTKAMEQVADGDFSVRLETKSSSKEIKEIYSGFNLMANELSKTEILQSDFVSNVSHEFKTPINAIEGYSTLLQDNDNLSGEQRQYVDKILFNTRRLSTLLGSILLLSKIENQSIPVNQVKYRLDEQIRQSIVALEPAWSKKEIEFDVEMDRVEYTGNEQMMHHVWDNLIGNAIKFNPECGMVRIRLNEQSGRVTFTVEDSGPGISEEAKRHIFDKFYQADSSHKEEGNGLGLALVKKILSVSGGEISVENISGGGCRFTVILHTK